jgi:hypothetical protein
MYYKLDILYLWGEGGISEHGIFKTLFVQRCNKGYFQVDIEIRRKI